jgi:hypothetical protein
MSNRVRIDIGFFGRRHLSKVELLAKKIKELNEDDDLDGLYCSIAFTQTHRRAENPDGY